MDESGIDHRLYRCNAWAPRGETVTAVVCGSRRQRTSVIGAWREGSFLAPMILQGSCDRHVIDLYFRNVLLPALPPGSVVVLDNASFHRASRAQELAHVRGIDLLYLPGYSPDLNPIEHFWARLKSHLRTHLPHAPDPFPAIGHACRFFCQKYTNVK